MCVVSKQEAHEITHPKDINLDFLIVSSGVGFILLIFFFPSLQSPVL